LTRKHFAIVLSSIVLFSTFCFSSTTRAQSVPDAQSAEKARATVQKIGLGRDARVEVKLRDQTKVKGYVSAAEQDFFTVTDSKTGTSQTVRYAEVAKVKKPGHGLSTTAWVMIGAAATAAIIIGIAVVKPVVCDGGAQSRGLC
jgi:redox-regulated HSP33 family molecular chaperone